MPRQPEGQGAIIVLAAIRRNPGLSVSDLARVVQRNPSTIEHHVHKLERRGLIVTERVGRARLVWVTGHRLQGVTRDA